MDSKNSIIISSRIRLARNLSNIVFPCKMKSQIEADNVINSVFEVLDNFENYRVSELDTKVLISLKEKHLISEELCKNLDYGALSLSHDEQISVMINEEEHIRAQCILPGFCLDEALDKLNEIDDLLMEKLSLAYDDNLGFLTTCPSNLGTGLRASVMMFLPALSLTNKIDGLINNLKEKGLTVRGNYGENSDAKGYMFQVSNSQTLGLSESEIIENVKTAVNKICELEQNAREQVLKSKNLVFIKDKIFRAYGTIKYAQVLSCDEAYKLLSQLKFGVALGFFTNLSFELLNELLEEIEPNTLSMIFDNISEENIDIFRAEYLSSKL